MKIIEGIKTALAGSQSKEVVIQKVGVSDVTGVYYSASTLEEAKELFEGVPVFKEEREKWDETCKLTNLIGLIQNIRFKNGELRGRVNGNVPNGIKRVFLDAMVKIEDDGGKKIVSKIVRVNGVCVRRKRDNGTA